MQKTLNKVGRWVEQNIIRELPLYKKCGGDGFEDTGEVEARDIHGQLVCAVGTG